MSLIHQFRSKVRAIHSKRHLLFWKQQTTSRIGTKWSLYMEWKEPPGTHYTLQRLRLFHVMWKFISCTEQNKIHERILVSFCRILASNEPRKSSISLSAKCNTTVEVFCKTGDKHYRIRKIKKQQIYSTELLKSSQCPGERGINLFQGFTLLRMKTGKRFTNDSIPHSINYFPPLIDPHSVTTNRGTCLMFSW